MVQAHGFSPVFVSGPISNRAGSRLRNSHKIALSAKLSAVCDSLRNVSSPGLQEWFWLRWISSGLTTVTPGPCPKAAYGRSSLPSGEEESREHGFRRCSGWSVVSNVAISSVPPIEEGCLPLGRVRTLETFLTLLLSAILLEFPPCQVSWKNRVRGAGGSH